MFYVEDFVFLSNLLNTEYKCIKLCAVICKRYSCVKINQGTCKLQVP